MVVGTLRHSIPKSVVYCQVREAKRSLLDHFFTELGAKEVSISCAVALLFIMFSKCWLCISNLGVFRYASKKPHISFLV